MNLNRCALVSSNGRKTGRGRARAPLLGLAEDSLTNLAPVRQRFFCFAGVLEGDEDEGATARLRKGESVGRPVGSAAFLIALETRAAAASKPSSGAKAKRRRSGRGC